MISDIDECASSPCECVDEVNGYTCVPNSDDAGKTGKGYSAERD